MLPEEVFADSAVLAHSLLGGLESDERGATTDSFGWIVLTSGNDAFALVSQLEQRMLAAGGTIITAGWRDGLLRPYGALLDIVEEFAAWAHPRQPELLQRFGWSLVNLLYPWRKSEAELPVGELRAGLADLVFRGDQTLIHQFFQKRNVRPQILSYLIHFLLEATSAIAATTSAPVVLCLENAHLADELSASAVQLFNRYARSKRVPVRICIIAETVTGSAFDVLLETGEVRQEWRVATLNSTASNALETILERLSPEQLAALQVATVFALPFNLSFWIEILPAELHATAETSIADFVAAGVLRELGDDRFRFASGGLRETIAEGLSVKECKHYHLHALKIEESKDVFVAAWHANVGRWLAELRAYCLAAMERAWAVSAYECALTFAERALAAPAEDSTLDENLLLAMLNYEAGRYDEAHRRLVAALEHPSGQLDRNFLEYLLGYNAVFGIADYKQGIEILNRVVSHYERKGDERGIAYVRNSLAFAHFCSRNVDEAISLEELNIDQLSRTQVSDSFLANVLQLNLGRLYRNSGDAERALKLLREGLFARRAELSSHALLLYYGTLGNFQFAKGDYSAALEAYYHSFEIIRNVQLDSVKDQVLLAFSKRVPELPPERTTRGDLLLYYIHFHLGLTCQKLGLKERADTYLAAIRQKADLLGASAVSAVEAAFRKESSRPVSSSKPAENSDENNITEVLNSLQGLVSEVPEEGSHVDSIVNALRSGQVVVIFHPHELGKNVSVTESLVLYDPSHRELGERMAQELESGGSHIKRAAAALFLPDSAALFQNVLSLPLIQQSTTLKPEYRAMFPALLPVKLCVQMFSQQFDRLLFDIIQGFGDENGHGVVAAAPFHLWRRDLVATAQQAVMSFLVSSIDVLLVEDRLIRKVHGATAMENLLNFRPRLSEEALVIEGSDSGNGSSVLIRIKRRGGYATDDLLKLHPGTRSILDLCDGRLSVAEVTQRTGLPQSESRDQQLCAFLRSLWHHGALCFDEPIL